MGSVVQRALLLSVLVVGCHPAPVSYPAVAAECSPARIGKVELHDVAVADVAPLVVLEGAFDDPERTDRITAVATEMLRVRGYPHAKIRVMRAAGCGVELHVWVDRGLQYRIADLEFETDDAFPDAERLAAVEDALGTVNAVGGAYVEDRLRRALAELERRYHDAGWIDASIDPPEATYDDARGAVTVVVPIHAGPRYRIGSVIAHGGGPETRAAVVDALGVKGGQWYDAARVRYGIDRARRRLERRIELRVRVGDDHETIDVEAVVGRIK